MEPVVVVVDAYHPVIGRVVPYVIQRVIEYGKTASPELPEHLTASQVLMALAKRDPTVMVLAFVDKTNWQVVGHLVATLDGTQDKKYVSIVQYRADGNIGEAGKKAVQQVEDWARGVGAENIVLIAAGNQGDRWKERGFTPIRTVLRKEIAIQ